MSFKGFLDHLLSSQSGGSLLNADFGKGAVAGGALGLLLGRKRVTRKLGTYGGLAAIGVMAYRAYDDYRNQQENAPISEPRPLDRLPPAQIDQHSEAILKALVAAAKSDGHMDDSERAQIEVEFRRISAGADIHGWLQTELARPLDPAEIARAASTPELAAEMYLASVLVTNDTSFMERAYLDELARQLGLAPELQSRLEQEAHSNPGTR